MIHLGTCGYSYDDWKGDFYPRELKKEDYLAYYAGQFDCLELNSSFYAIPAPALVQRLAETPASFRVVVKAYRGITHERRDPAADLARFLGAIEPLRASGRLAAVLLQFPYSFHRTPENLELLDRLLGPFGELPAVIEFRHREWVDPEVWKFLSEREAAWCCVDEPRLPNLMPPEIVRTTKRLGYVRFHGRNGQKWWDYEDPAERYDYLYSEEELRGWEREIRWLESRTGETFIFFNNHRQGQATRNARQLRLILGQQDGEEAGR